MTTTEMLKIQFYDSYNMLKEVAGICPDELWYSENHGLPVWNHVIHTLMGIAFWLREDYESVFSWSLPFPERLGKKIIDNDWVELSDGFLTKTEINNCFDYLDNILNRFWLNLNDETLNKTTWKEYSFSYLSVITAQIRHIMCHVGMCNAALIENGFEEIKWIAYGEE